MQQKGLFSLFIQKLQLRNKKYLFAYPGIVFIIIVSVYRNIYPPVFLKFE